MDILPVDGLIGDYDYNDKLRDSGVVEYLRSNDIRYWLGPTISYPQRHVGYINTITADGSQIIDFFAPLYNVSAGSFTATPERQMVDFKKALAANPLMFEIGLWEIFPSNSGPKGNRNLAKMLN